MTKIGKGTIIGLRGWHGSGLAFLETELRHLAAIRLAQPIDISEQN